MDFKYRVSVIIPVYNVEEYLDECIVTLFNQTIDTNDMEVLLINDGSVDNSLEICLKYAELYPNIRVFSKENEGLSATRNLGIKNANGKYIAYLDADDKYSDETLKNTCDFFDAHYDEVDIVTFPIVRYKNGKTLPLHYRYKYLTKTGVYDLEKQPYISQSNINILVKNQKNDNVFFDTTPGFRHEDQAYNSTILERTMKIGFVKEAEYMYNRDNESSIIATYMHAFHIFESTTNYWENLFGKYDSVPQYLQVQFFNDIVWKFAESRLWPYHYDDGELLNAKNRIYELLKKVDVDVIMSFPNADNYQKMYWIRHKDNASVTPVLLPNKMQILVDGENVYWRKDAEIILKRILVKGNNYKVIGYFKSPLFSMTEKPDFYVNKNKEKMPLIVNIASSSYHKSKERTDCFYGFEYEGVVQQNNIDTIMFGFTLDGIDFDVAFYNTAGVPFYRKSTTKYSAGSLTIEQRGNELIFANADETEITLVRKENHNRFINNTKVLKTRLSAERLYGKRIWLYYDNYTVTFDNGFLQFQHDLHMKDGVERYYVLDKKSIVNMDMFTPEQLNYIVYFGSAQHQALFLAAEKILTSFIEHFSISPFKSDEEYHYRDLMNAEYIYLQHGVLHAHLPWFYTPIGTEVDKVIVSSKFEIENFTKNYGFKEKNVLPYGMARYSILDREQSAQNRIVFAPSWRSYLVSEPTEAGGKREGNVSKLVSSSYFKGIMDFLNDPKLIHYLEEKDLYLDVKLHPNFYYFFQNGIEFESDRVLLAPNKINLSDYKLFITDFSSFVFDYAYLMRPILYFIPDFLEFKSGMNRYRELDLPLEEAFGPFVRYANNAVSELIKICDRDFRPEQIYYERMETFFLPMHNPCNDIYEYLMNH
ncbi:MAG: glycosyltransferase [Agathobacter sp.]